MELQLKMFDMKQIVFKKNLDSDGTVIIMIGKRGTGKSLLVKDLLFHHKDIPMGCVISGTEIGNHFYSELVPKLFIHHLYDNKIVEKTLRRQLQVIKTKLSDPRCFLILDDCMYDNKWVRDKIMRLVFMNGRHWKLMFILTMQDPLAIPPNLRSQCDYIFILRENLQSNRKKIYDHYAGIFPSYEYFCKVLSSTTENYECLVIKNSGLSNKLCDQVFWYKAQIRSPFKMGSQEIWDLSSKMVFEDEDIFADEKTQKAAASKIDLNVKKMRN